MEITDETKKPTTETVAFTEMMDREYRCINPCFMTGKGCVYTDQIEDDIRKRVKRRELYKGKKYPTAINGNQKTERPITGFTIIPFKPNFLTFYGLCLSRYITGEYDARISLEKADSVRKTGYVICEKICKKIQESDFVIADISVPNPNVFYELGLAFGSEQKIILIASDDSSFARSTSKFFGTQVFSYHHLDPLTQKDFMLSRYVWHTPHTETPLDNLSLLLIEDSSILEKVPLHPVVPISEEPVEERRQALGRIPRPQDIPLDFATHIKAALGVAVDNIYEKVKNDSNTATAIPNNYKERIRSLYSHDESLDANEKTGIVQAGKNSSFSDIIKMINNAFCVMIKTGKDCHPMMYFWLGYCHALGKNVIPITVINADESRANSASNSIEDLAFDIRALWHVVFDSDKPEDLVVAMEETLYQMITKDFKEWARKRFWDKILGKRGTVSIFTGALHNKAIGREMIGDWDLRAASELTSYFASHQYRATIDSPVYHFDRETDQADKEKAKDNDNDNDKAAYIRELKKMLFNRNCVIIASPDVNPLTEILLGQVYGIPQDKWFTAGCFPEEDNNDAVVAYKAFPPKQKQADDAGKETKHTPRAITFYREVVSENSPKKVLARGFINRYMEGLKPQHMIQGGFVSQKDDKKDSFKVHAHLMVVPNPFVTDRSTRKYVVLLNGVSGPATFALTHVLTGGESGKFVSYGEPDDTNPFDPHSNSENVLQMILTQLNLVNQSDTPMGVQCFIEVEVGMAKRKTTTAYDWRHILRWSLYNHKKAIRSFQVTMLRPVEAQELGDEE